MKHLTYIVKLLSRKIYLNFCGGKELSPALTGFIGEVIDKTAGIYFLIFILIKTRRGEFDLVRSLLNLERAV